MSVEDEIVKLVDVVKAFKAGAPLKNYITHLRFPRFKNIEPGAEVKFDFAFTALVGANGIGKTSILHALWGAPYGKSTSKFWFATDLDPIQGDKAEPQRFVYGHWSESFNGVVETRKARIGKKRDYDYWEPYRSSVTDGMPKIPKGSYEGKAKDRWQPVRRSVIYINLKMSFGSFDRYFYLEQGGDLGDRRATMLNEAKRLKSIKDRNLISFSLGRRQRLFENRDLSVAELKAVGSILGRTYKSARIIIHSLYPGNRGRDMTVIFNRNFEYSEAFAGSGEVAAVSVVVQVLAAEPFSLVLLDEPETSLHPGAQRALLRFLLQQIKIKKLQVIASTHSADFLEGLPDAAIKVLEDNGDGKTRVINNCSPLVALNRLGRPPAGKMRVLVEDPLACMLVEHALGGLDPGERAAIEVRVAPGGAGAILGHHGPGAMITGDRLFVLLDGDQKKVDEFTDPDTIPPAKYSVLAELIKKETGAAPAFLLAGGNDVEGRTRALIESHLNYLTWLRGHVRYLPKLCPEQVLLDSTLIESTGTYNNSEECKLALKEILGKGVDISGRELQTLFKVAVAQLPLDQVDIAIIASQLRSWLSAENPV